MTDNINRPEATHKQEFNRLMSSGFLVSTFPTLTLLGTHPRVVHRCSFTGFRLSLNRRAKRQPVASPPQRNGTNYTLDPSEPDHNTKQTGFTPGFQIHLAGIDFAN